MQKFFTETTQKTTLAYFNSQIPLFSSESDFEKERNQHLKEIIDSIIANAEEYDKSCQINIELIGSSFISSMAADSSSIMIHTTKTRHIVKRLFSFQMLLG